MKKTIDPSAENAVLRQEIRTAHEAADITAHLVIEQFEKVEELLARVEYANAQRKAVLDAASSVAIIAVDREGVITLFNVGAERILGYDAQEVVGKVSPLAFHLQSELEEKAVDLSQTVGRPLEGLDVLVESARGDRGRMAEWNYVRKDGSQLPVCLAITPLKGPEGEPAGFLCAGFDITDRRKAEQAIMVTMAQLERRNEFIRQVFGRYLSDEVVSSLLESPEGLVLGGESREVTVMMADLRGFSSLAEHLAPAEVIKLLNNFLGTMAGIVVKHGGTIDEFIGDAILAIFGAPTRRPDHARRAVACAVEMQMAMPRVNDFNIAAGLPQIEMGIGLNSGEVVVGNIGSELRSKYGVVGRNVNLASRIEAYTIGGQILISESTLAAAGDDLRIDNSIEVFPKGSAKPMQIHQVGGIEGEYQLALPVQARQLCELAQPLPIWFSVLDGKNITAADREGVITHLCAKQARIAAVSPVESMAVLKFDWPAAPGIPSHIYGKVLYAGDGGTDLLLHFTSVSPAAQQAISGLVEGVANVQ